jgi:phthiocerol/phenolphthiocerol synthesis type-I polyketide synthase C
MTDYALTGRGDEASSTDRPPCAATNAMRQASGLPSHELVAIVGMACRMPGAHSKEHFWAALRAGRDCITPWPEQRSPVSAAQPIGHIIRGAKEGGFIDNVDEFDAGFFHISPKEAQRMDPQQRLLLELAWEALEDAGCRASAVRHTDGGVFVGISHSDYSQSLFSGKSAVDSYSSSANAISIAANRLSFFFDLTGPSIAIDTACSSSLTAAHLACTSLRDDECGFALVAGVNLILAPELTGALDLAGILSPDFRCKPFSAHANGYVRGEGCGVVVMKRLSRALRDNDRIYAVVRGSAIGQNGRSNGLTSPNPVAQKTVLRAAAARAGVDPNAIDYVEAHGTGTSLGDQIELLALSRVYCDLRAPTRPLLLGAVKSNIGHLEAAAGMAGLIKTSLALYHGELPGSLHADPPNESIDFAASKIEVLRGSRPWPDRGQPKMAGLSSFGFGGANAHLILSEAPALPVRPADHQGASHLIVLSANTPGALSHQANQLAGWLDVENGGVPCDLGDLAYTCLVRRDALRFRRAFVTDSTVDLASQLTHFATGVVESGVPRAARVRAAFWFGEAPLAWLTAMWTACCDDPAFRSITNRCDEALATIGESWSVAGFMSSQASQRARVDLRIVALAVQLGIVHALKAYGVEASASQGRGRGRIVAAVTSGVLPLQQAMTELLVDAAVPREPSRHEPHDESDVDITPPDAGFRTVWFVCGGPAPSRDEGNTLLTIEVTTSRGKTALLDALARWYGAGGEVRHRASEGVEPRVVSLPPYPWDRTRYWLEATASDPVARRPTATSIVTPVDTEGSSAGYAPALSALESSLLAIWEEIVSVRPFSVTDRLLQIGKPAHITRFRGAIAEKLGKSISLDRVTRSPTIRDLARALETDTEDRRTLQLSLSRGTARRSVLTRSHG